MARIIQIDDNVTVGQLAELLSLPVKKGKDFAVNINTCIAV